MKSVRERKFLPLLKGGCKRSDAEGSEWWKGLPKVMHEKAPRADLPSVSS